MFGSTNVEFIKEIRIGRLGVKLKLYWFGYVDMSQEKPQA